MKATVYKLDGSKKGEIEMPKLFGRRIRKDIVMKYVEADKFIQPYSPAYNAGRKHSASGTISHKRHDWKGHYGRGISRVPRKTMWRRGTQFFWIGAEISGTRGGRRAHGPKGIGKEKKINNNEVRIAMESGFAATANKKLIESRYSSLDKVDFVTPMVISSSGEIVKTKTFVELFKKLFGDVNNLIWKNKVVRAGVGKKRGRKYKSNAGALLVVGSDEEIKLRGVDVIPVKSVQISDLYPLGRITVYTEKAIEELRTTEEIKQ